MSEIDDWVEIAVDDDGRGMPPETMEKAFEMFFTTEGRRGTGIGLNSVASSVHCVGGYVEVQSKPNQGTRITCRIPRALDVRSQSLQPQIQTKSRGSGRILLAEENTQLRGMLCQRLEASGFEVQPASSGAVAFECLDGAQYTALCTDSILAGKSSRELIEGFVRQFPRSLVVQMSGYFSEDLEDTLKQHRETRFLRKPFAAGELIGLLARNSER